MRLDRAALLLPWLSCSISRPKPACATMPNPAMCFSRLQNQAAVGFVHNSAPIPAHLSVWRWGKAREEGKDAPAVTKVPGAGLQWAPAHRAHQPSLSGARRERKSQTDKINQCLVLFISLVHAGCWSWPFVYLAYCCCRFWMFVLPQALIPADGNAVKAS